MMQQGLDFGKRQTIMEVISLRDRGRFIVIVLSFVYLHIEIGVDLLLLYCRLRFPSLVYRYWSPPIKLSGRQIHDLFMTLIGNKMQMRMPPI